VTVSVRSTSIREKDSDLVESLRRVSPEIPLSFGVSEVSLRVALLAVNKVRELNGIFNEEDWGVVSDHIVVALFGVELNGEATRVARSIGRAELASDSRESEEKRSPLADRVEELGLSKLGNIVSNLEVAVGACALGVNDALRDSLSVELGEFVDQVEVLEENRAAGASSE